MTDQWTEKKLEYDRAVDFLDNVKAGDVVRLERYAYPEWSPYGLNRDADIHTRGTYQIFATNKEGLWFTVTTGEAIDARSVITWEKIPRQLELGI